MESAPIEVGMSNGVPVVLAGSLGAKARVFRTLVRLFVMFFYEWILRQMLFQLYGSQ